MIKQARLILDKFNIVYIAAQTRTGKTLASIFLLKNDYDNILVVTKKKAISSWLSDLELSQTTNFEVINYESIHKLEKQNFDVIILDESHCIGSYPKPSKRAKSIKEIAKDKKIVYLSATPSAETYSQIFHQFWISSFSPFSEANFYKWYKNYGQDDCIMIQGRIRKRYKKIYVDIIMDKIEHLMVTMTKLEAKFDVFVQEKIHLIQAPTHLIEGIKYFEKHKVLTIGKHKVEAQTPTSIITKSHQLSGGTIKIDEQISIFISLHKVNYLLNHFKDENKIVVLCNYVKERELLLKKLPNSTDDVDKFRNEPYRYFVGHIKTFSEGVDFSYASCMIIYSLNFSATTYLQSKERLANKKRTKAIIVHYLFTKNTLDEYIYKAVTNKMNFTSRYYSNYK